MGCCSRTGAPRTPRRTLQECARSEHGRAVQYRTNARGAVGNRSAGVSGYGGMCSSVQPRPGRDLCVGARRTGLQRRGPLSDRHRRQGDPLRELPPFRGAAGHGLRGSPAADGVAAQPARKHLRSHQRDDARVERQPVGLFRCHPGPRRNAARRDGQRRRGRRHDGHAVSGLPRPNVGRRLADPHLLAGRTDVPELPHRDCDGQQWPDPLHVRAALERPTARGD